MTIRELCDLIDLQEVIKEKVLVFSEEFDFSTVEKILEDFRDYKKIKSARLELQGILGEDEDRIKILTCMLKASANLYDVYKAKEISDEVYVETMKCYTRFINETYRMTGKYEFDRYWWTARQAGGYLYRIGELEYELKLLSDKQVIDIHIPSDADFSPKAVDESLEMAKEFLRVYYPEMSDCDFTCDSWLLSRQLEGMLKEESNIRSFAKRFEIWGEGEPDIEFIEWIFNTKTDNYEMLPENTSLQRGMKKFILSGGVFRNGYGVLKKEIMKTLYVSDLDGTLLRSNETTSEYTNKTINRLVEEGMIFSYATARSFQTSHKVTKGLNAKIPLIIYNGAMVVDNNDGTFLIKNFFEEEIKNVMEDLFDKRDNPISNEADLCQGEMFYITCIDEKEKLEPLYQKYKDRYHCVFQVDIYTKHQWLEIMPKAASKANAIKQLKEQLGCDRLVVFGDGKNDIDMFELSDEAYAVENAVDELKEAATAVIGSNNDDGVAKWLDVNVNTGREK